MSLHILHLSDLHFDNKTDPEELAAKIFNVLLIRKLSPDVIVVTGDIFNGNFFSSTDYKVAIDKAVVFFYGLSSDLNINNYPENLFFVPGNHEINRESIEKNKPEEQLSRYREFLARIYAEKWDDIAASVYNKEEACFVKHFIDKKTILIGLNSPRYEKKKDGNQDLIETARIGSTQIKTINSRMRSINGYDDNRVIACLHNNIYNTLEYAPSENIDATCVQDNDPLLSMLSTYNCSLILYGHKHKQKNRRINLTQSIKEKDRLCTVIGGGKATDSFNYLEIYDKDTKDELKCMEFHDDSGRYVLHEAFEVPVNLSRIIEDTIKSDSNLSRDYKSLKETDSNCDSKLIEMFEGVLGIFNEISDNFYPIPKSGINLLYIILGTIHYRSNFWDDKAFIKQSEIFIRKVTDRLGLSDKVIQMLQVEDACALYSVYEKQKNNILPEHKKVFIFLALSLYLSEFFLTIKNRPNEFYLNHIQHKTNYRLDENDIITAINGRTIKFEVNEEHRALEITVKCSTANSYKIVSLIIKEFELILSKFEEDFASVGFRVYYTLPKLTKADIVNEKLESFEFAAYIPHLIPLLAGKNIYSEPEVFARELIQNSIDALKVREEHEKNTTIDNTNIELEIGEDSSKGQKYFKITDHGTGMSRYVLERYLTIIGRSFYTSADFKKMEIKYRPISQFGIGFLSCFMLGKQIEVYTTYHENLNESFFLDIPNVDGCFFIETRNEKKDSSGSSIIVWEDRELIEKQKGFNIEKIKKYIKDNICNIPFDITLNNEMFIPKFNFFNKLINETKKHNFLFFIPLASTPDDNGNVIVDEKITDHSEHGIYFYKKDESLFDFSENIVMNNGILVKKSNFSEEKTRKIHPYLDAVYNFPSYAMELDVSRDEIKKLREFNTRKIKNTLQKKIYDYLKTDTAKNIEYVFWCLLDNDKYKLSEINICYTSEILNVNMEKYIPDNEFDEVCNVINRIDKLNNNMKKHIKKRANISYHYHEFDNYYNSRFYSHEAVIIKILSYFEKKYRLNNLSKKDMLQFQNELISYITSNGSLINALKKYIKIDKTNLSNFNKLISFILMFSDDNFYKYFQRINRNMNDDLDKYVYKLTINSKTIIITSMLKLFFSTIFSYSDLKKGFSIPFDNNSINKMLNISSKK
jgi:hypothetical protein